MKFEDFKGKELVIYGAGHVGKKFYRTLQRHGLEKQVLCFAVTGQVEKEALIEGLPVKCVYDVSIRSDTLVCLAVHESLLEEVEKVVRSITEQYIWIYPYLYELMFGEPEQKEKEIEISKILKTCRDDARLAIRLAAVEQYYGKNSFGNDYYKRAQMMHCAEHTAGQRLQQFERLMEDWEKYGYRKEYPLSLNRGYEVIDGNHRLALAVYHDKKRIFCNIYPTEIPLTGIHGQEPVMPAEVLMRHGFTRDEIEKLDEVQRRYMDAYGE